MRHGKRRWLGVLLRELASLGLAPLARSVRASCREFVHGVLEESLSSARHTLRLYAVLLGLAVLAALAMGTALEEGMTALGLPRWGSCLVLGSVALGAAGVVSGRLDSIPREARERKDGRSDGERALTSLDRFMIGRPGPRPGGSPRARRERSRPRRRRIVEVRPKGNIWEVRSGRAPGKKEIFPTEREAVSRALDLARRNAAEVLISGKPSPKGGSFQGVA